MRKCHRVDTISISITSDDTFFLTCHVLSSSFFPFLFFVSFVAFICHQFRSLIYFLNNSPSSIYFCFVFLHLASQINFTVRTSTYGMDCNDALPRKTAYKIHKCYDNKFGAAVAWLPQHFSILKCECYKFCFAVIS